MTTNNKQLEKPGIKTTEFWVSTFAPILVTFLMYVLNQIGIVLDPATISTFVVGIITPPIAYIIGRVFNKKKVADIEKSKIEKGEKENA